MIPLAGTKQVDIPKTDSLHSVCVAATDKPGLGAELCRYLAEAGINLRGFSGAAIGRKAVFHLAFDTSTDAGKAIRKLKAL